MNKICGVIVLYNPENDVLSNISTYIENIDKLYVIDNSENKNTNLLNILFQNSKIKYIDNKGNQGIANALNMGCCEALKDSYEWILTMDQDSKASDKMIAMMLPFLELDDVAIVSPYHANQFAPKSLNKKNFSLVLTIMTSGNLLNLAHYQKIGPFMEELFIDYVDSEYCLRSNKLGYKVIQVNKAILEHKLGDLKQHKIFHKQFYNTNHSAIRRYYIFRNRGMIIARYKSLYSEYTSPEFYRYFIDFVIVLLYEKDKLKKFVMMYKGIRDFYRKQSGVYKG